MPKTKRGWAADRALIATDQEHEVEYVQEHYIKRDKETREIEHPPKELNNYSGSGCE